MYSRRIIGYDLSDSPELKGCVRALKKAIYQTKISKGSFIIQTEEYSTVAICILKSLKEKS